MDGTESLKIVLVLLGELKIPHMLVGSFSSNFYGVPRSTKDADLVLEMDSKSFASFLEKLPSNIRSDEQSFFEMVTATRKELLHIEGSAFKIELFHLSADEFDQVRFRNRIQVEYFQGISTFVPRKEDVVIQKLRWAKGGKREKDFKDVVSILQVSETMDFSYIESWCAKHESLELLGEAREAAGA